MKAKGSELEFISRIKRDGSGTEPVTEERQKTLQDDSKILSDEYKLNRLSISEDTYIASGFNSYVVKKKEKVKQRIEIAEIAPGLNGSDGLIREHHKAKKRRQDKYMWLLREQNPSKHTGKVKLTYTRQSVQKMDWDNLSASFKHWGDALTKMGIIEDDNPDVIVDFHPKWKKAEGYDSQKTIIEIEDVE